jgi:hypothetical protein
MTENELLIQRIEDATKMAKGRVVSPCISVISSVEGSKISSMCPLLDINQGCKKGFMKEQGSSVKCPEGKGTIIIHSGIGLKELKIGEIALMTSLQQYALELLNLEPASNIGDAGQNGGELFV